MTTSPHPHLHFPLHCLNQKSPLPPQRSRHCHHLHRLLHRRRHRRHRRRRHPLIPVKHKNLNKERPIKTLPKGEKWKFTCSWPLHTTQGHIMNYQVLHHIPVSKFFIVLHMDKTLTCSFSQNLLTIWKSTSRMVTVIAHTVTCPMAAKGRMAPSTGRSNKGC